MEKRGERKQGFSGACPDARMLCEGKEGGTCEQGRRLVGESRG
jgi:hypothetical protein